MIRTSVSCCINYIENKPRYLGIGNVDEAGFNYMEKGIPIGIYTFKRAMAKKVKIVFGTRRWSGRARVQLRGKSSTVCEMAALVAA